MMKRYNYYVHWNVLLCWGLILWAALCTTDLYHSEHSYTNEAHKPTSFPHFANTMQEDERSPITASQVTEERIECLENTLLPTRQDYNSGNHFARSKMIALSIEIFVFVCLISIVAYTQCQLKSTADTNSTLTFCVHNAKVSSRYYNNEKKVEHSYNELICESSLAGHSAVVSGLLEQMSRCITQEVKNTILDREQLNFADKKSMIAPLSFIKLQENDRNIKKNFESRHIDKKHIISSSPAFQEFLSKLRNSRCPYTCTCQQSIAVKDKAKKVYRR